MEIHLLPADPQRASALHQLMQLHLYDLSEYLECSIDDNGLFAVEPLSAYFGAHNCPLFILIQNQLAGFALIHKKVHEEQTHYYLDDFFILRRWRRLGLEKIVLQKIWLTQQGAWQVRCLKEDAHSLHYTHEAIEHFTGGVCHPRLMQENKKNWLIYQFLSNHGCESPEQKIDDKMRLHRQIDPAG